MTSDPTLLTFLRERIAFVREELKGQGWNESQIKDAFEQVAHEVSGTKPEHAVVPKTKVPRRQLTASLILQFLGGLIVIIAGIIYGSLNWQIWSPAVRVLIIAVPTIVPLLIGILLARRPRWKSQSVIFFFIGALMIPVFLAVWNVQYNVFTHLDFDMQALILGAVTVAVYSALAISYAHPVWTMLVSVASLWNFVALLAVLGAFDQRWAVWLFFIPVIAFYVLSEFVERKGSHMSARVFLGLGMVALVGELYALGVGAQFVWSFVDQQSRNMTFDTLRYIHGLSLVFTGGLSAFLGWLMTRSRSVDIQKMMRLFRGIAILMIFSGVFGLGLGGSHPFLETLVLLMSLVAIFGSARLHSRALLYSGTLFLVIYIFGIGGEYFQNEVGWPITLFVAGLLSMGAGVLMERIRRRYLKE